MKAGAREMSVWMPGWTLDALTVKWSSGRASHLALRFDSSRNATSDAHRLGIPKHRKIATDSRSERRTSRYIKSRQRRSIDLLMPTTWTRVWSRACELFMPQGLKQKTVTNLILIRLHRAAGAEQNLKVITSAPQSQDIRIPIRIPLNGWFQFVILQNGWVAIPFNIFQASPLMSLPSSWARGTAVSYKLF